VLKLDRLAAVKVVDGRLAVAMVDSDGKTHEFSLHPAAVTTLFVGIQSNAEKLPEHMARGLIPKGFQARMSPVIGSGLLVNLGGNLQLVVALPPDRLASLRATLDQIESLNTQSGQPPTSGAH